MYSIIVEFNETYRWLLELFNQRLVLLKAECILSHPGRTCLYTVFYFSKKELIFKISRCKSNTDVECLGFFTRKNVIKERAESKRQYVFIQVLHANVSSL